MKIPSSIENDRVYRMDCLEGMKLMKSSTVDVVVTSPPYNIGKPYATHDDTMPYDEYLDWMHRIAHEARRVLCDEGSFFLNIGGK
jgi:site-specific DNA-methyltransferase (adenine-specific)